MEIKIVETLSFATPLSVGTRVKIMRMAQLLTQVELAELAGVTQQDVSLLERNQPVRPEARSRIFSFLGLNREGEQV